MIALWKIFHKDYFTASKKTFYEKVLFITDVVIFMNVKYKFSGIGKY